MEGSYHYKDLALDIRTMDLKPEQREQYHLQLKERLGLGYDVILEKDHIHVEPHPMR